MHITLDYDVSVGLQNPTTVATQVAAIPVNQEFEFLQMTKTGDSTTVVGSSLVRRSIILQTTAASDEMFPTTDELKAATRGLLSGVLGFNTPGSVSASEPVVTP